MRLMWGRLLNQQLRWCAIFFFFGRPSVQVQLKQSHDVPLHGHVDTRHLQRQQSSGGHFSTEHGHDRTDRTLDSRPASCGAPAPSAGPALAPETPESAWRLVVFLGGTPASAAQRLWDCQTSPLCKSLPLGLVVLLFLLSTGWGSLKKWTKNNILRITGFKVWNMSGKLISANVFFVTYQLLWGAFHSRFHSTWCILSAFSRCSFSSAALRNCSNTFLEDLMAAGVMDCFMSSAQDLALFRTKPCRSKRFSLFNPEACDSVRFIDLQLSQGKWQQNDGLNNKLYFSDL